MDGSQVRVLPRAIRYSERKYSRIMKFKNALEPNSSFRTKSEIDEDNNKTEVSDKSFEEKRSQFHQYVAGIVG